MRSRRLLAAAIALAAIAACASPPGKNERLTVTTPDRATFPAVSDLLVHRCGSLDCHGSVQRNLRLYGNEGLRLDPKSRPSSQHNTTPAEIDENFRSLVGLEPELFGAVVAGGGADPQRLTFLRKARATEAHEGGAVFVVGDDQDVCITSWLSGRTDLAACSRARESTP